MISNKRWYLLKGGISEGMWYTTQTSYIPCLLKYSKLKVSRISCLPLSVSIREKLNSMSFGIFCGRARICWINFSYTPNSRSSSQTSFRNNGEPESRFDNNNFIWNRALKLRSKINNSWKFSSYTDLKNEKWQMTSTNKSLCIAQLKLKFSSDSYLVIKCRFV